jgi:hypothetical protein
VWAISQAKHKKNWNKHKGTTKSDWNVQLRPESEQGHALLNLEKWPLGQTKEVMLQVVAVMWSKMVLKTIPNRLR